MSTCISGPVIKPFQQICAGGVLIDTFINSGSVSGGYNVLYDTSGNIYEYSIGDSVAAPGFTTPGTTLTSNFFLIQGSQIGHCSCTNCKKACCCKKSCDCHGRHHHHHHLSELAGGTPNVQFQTKSENVPTDVVPSNAPGIGVTLDAISVNGITIESIPINNSVPNLDSSNLIKNKSKVSMANNYVVRISPGYSVKFYSDNNYSNLIDEISNSHTNTITSKIDSTKIGSIELFKENGAAGWSKK